MRIYCSYKGDGMFWFRIFGRGLSIRDTNKHPLTFSERNRYTWYLKIKRFIINFI